MNKSGLSDAEEAAAAKEFEKLGVHPQLAEAAASLGWKKPSAIQEQAVPQLLKGPELAVIGRPIVVTTSLLNIIIRKR